MEKYGCDVITFTAVIGQGSETKDARAKAKKLGLQDFFELNDDEDRKYYSGYANFSLMAENDLDEFTILDMATYDSGCTYMKTRNKDGKMTIV